MLVPLTRASASDQTDGQDDQLHSDEQGAEARPDRTQRAPIGLPKPEM
jgi:hypothetical protein